MIGTTISHSKITEKLGAGGNLALGFLRKKSMKKIPNERCESRKGHLFAVYSLLKEQKNKGILPMVQLPAKVRDMLLDENKAAGNYGLRWDGKDMRSRDMPSGIYLLKFSSGRISNTRKMLLLR